MLTKQQVVLFDIDNTLYDQLEPFGRAVADQVPEFEGELEWLHQLSRQYSDAAFLKVQSGEMSQADSEIYRTQSAFRHFGLDLTEEEAAAFERAYARYLGEIRLRPTMREALDWCREREIPLGIISNGQSARQRRKLSAMGLADWVDDAHVFISAEVGAAKPDVAIFRRAEAVMGFQPRSAWYVGDDYRADAAGARQAGWHAIWFNVYGEVDLPKASPLPDYTLTPDDSLAALLAGIAPD